MPRETPPARNDGAGGSAGGTRQHPQDRVVQFSKTKMCTFHQMGICGKGAQCPFAHGRDELRALPDLRCTKMCVQLLNVGYCDNKDCTYAHTRDELRNISAYRKTKLCRFFVQSGVCMLGTKCNFAHSEQEIRQLDQEEGPDDANSAVFAVLAALRQQAAVSERQASTRDSFPDTPPKARLDAMAAMPGPVRAGGSVPSMPPSSRSVARPAGEPMVDSAMLQYNSPAANCHRPPLPLPHAGGGYGAAYGEMYSEAYGEAYSEVASSAGAGARMMMDDLHRAEPAYVPVNPAFSETPPFYVKASGGKGAVPARESCQPQLPQSTSSGGYGQHVQHPPGRVRHRVENKGTNTGAGSSGKAGQ